MSFANAANVEHLQSEANVAAEEAAKALLALQAAKDVVSRNRGRYVDPGQWSAMLDAERNAGHRHQRALSRVSDLKRRLKDARVAMADREWEAKQAESAAHQLGFAEHFLNTARRLLDPDVFAGLMREATLERNRDLIPTTPNASSGAALGVHGGSAGFRRRKAE